MLVHRLQRIPQSFPIAIIDQQRGPALRFYMMAKLFGNRLTAGIQFNNIANLNFANPMV
jgi:hypothetical protein